MPRVQLFGSASLQLSDYSRTNALFLRERDDTGSAARSMATAGELTITPQLSYRRNDSNIPLNEYDRLDAGVRAKWQFCTGRPARFVLTVTFALKVFRLILAPRTDLFRRT